MQNQRSKYFHALLICLVVWVGGSQSLSAANVASLAQPEWAPPYVGLATAYGVMGARSGALSMEEALTMAEPPLMRALELDPSPGVVVG